jgi:DNA primase
MGTWIDFKKLREELDFGRVLEHYKVAVKRRGSQGTAQCPLPSHPRESTSLSFSVSFQKCIFQCFGCQAKGNVLDFVAIMEGLNPRSPQDFRKAAVIAQERFGGGVIAGPPKSSPPPMSNPSSKGHELPAQPNLPVLVNQPLDFALKNLDSKPQYLLSRGFTQETIDHFGLGYCTKGTFAGRIVIPLHDLEGRLVGYAGRLIFDEAIDPQNPKYLYPPRRERDGKVLEFAKSLLLYHGHAIKAPVSDLVVVQSFPAVWWLWQCGHQNVVGLMGATCSVDQAAIIVQLVTRRGRVWFLPDASNVGEKCALNLFNEIAPRRFCCWLKLPQGQPTECDPDELQAMLQWQE